MSAGENFFMLDLRVIAVDAFGSGGDQRVGEGRIAVDLLLAVHVR